MLSIVPVVSNIEVFTHRSLRSRGDKSKAVVKDDLKCLILVNKCSVLVNKFCTTKCGRMTHGLKLLGYGMLFG